MPRVPKTPGHRPIRLVRGLLLGGMLLLVAVVTGLLLLGRSSRPEEPAEESREDGGPAAAPEESLAPEATVLSSGFDYEQQVDGRPVFRLQGDRFVTDREGRVALEGVRLTLFREGEPYYVTSEKATYQQETQEADLQGSVRVEGGDGWSLASNRLDLVEGGRVVVTGGGRAHFARGEGIAGEAGSIRYELDGERLLMSGRVIMSGREEPERPRFGLTAARVEWERAASVIRARDKVFLSWGESVMRSEVVDVTTDADGETIHEARASEGATGTLLPGEGRSIGFASVSAVARFDPESHRPSTLVLSSEGAAQPVRVESRATGEPERRLAAAEVTLGLRGGELREAEARGGAALEEGPRGRAVRTARADEIDASFDLSGALESAVLRVSVQIRDGDVLARGDEATLAEGGSRTVLTGAPAFGRNRRGELAAPTIEYASESGKIHATGGVRAQMGDAAPALPGAGEGGDGQAAPTVVEAGEATFDNVARSYSFVGDVQAAQGEALLFASRLDGSEEPARSVAEGPVRTVWSDAADPAGETTTVQSDRLEYDRDAASVEYLGSVVVRQGAREIASNECRADLDDKGAVRAMRASGAVKIVDRATKRTVEGDVADYDLAADQILVTGERVILREADGGVLRGRRALFELATGTARILSESP